MLCRALSRAPSPLSHVTCTRYGNARSSMDLVTSHVSTDRGFALGHAAWPQPHHCAMHASLLSSSPMPRLPSTSPKLLLLPPAEASLTMQSPLRADPDGHGCAAEGMALSHVTTLATVAESHHAHPPAVGLSSPL